MAYESSSPSSWKAEILSKVSFFDHEIPTAQNSYSLCKVCIYLKLLLIEVTQVGRRNRVKAEEKWKDMALGPAGYRKENF